MDDIAFRGYLLEYLYSKDYKYIVCDKYGEIYAVDTLDKENISKFAKCLTSFRNLLADVKYLQPLNIAIEIGVFDWTKVPENTPVLVRQNENEVWQRMHFFGYTTMLDEPFICYRDGLSKYTVGNIRTGIKYQWFKHCRMAEGEE